MDELEKLKSALSKVKPEDIHCEGEESAKVEVSNTIDISGLGYSVDLSALNTSVLGGGYSNNHNTYGNVTISNGGAIGSMFSSNGASPIWTGNITTGATSIIDVKGDANFEGDIKWKGRSLGDMLETIENRLSILVPNPEKLEHFEALKKAYEHYKILEALCEIPKKEKE
jgi:hypothetical protein